MLTEIGDSLWYIAAGSIALGVLLLLAVVREVTHHR